MSELRLLFLLRLYMKMPPASSSRLFLRLMKPRVFPTHPPSLPTGCGHVSYTASKPRGHGLSLDGPSALISLIPKISHE